MLSLTLNGTTIDVGENFGDFFKASYAIGSPANPTVKGNNAAREVTLPASPTNNDFFEHAYVSRPYDSGIKGEYIAVVTEDGSTIFKGTAIVKYIDKNGDMPDGYSLVMTSGAKEWDEALKDAYLSNLDWTDQAYTTANVETSWTAAGDDVEYRYIPINYGKWSREDYVYIEDLRPALRWYHVLTKALKYAGFELSSDFFSSTFFKSFYLPFIGTFRQSQAYLDAQSFNAKLSSGQALTNAATDLILDTEINDPSDIYNNSTGVYTAAAHGSFAYTGSVTIKRTSGDPKGLLIFEVYKNGVKIVFPDIPGRTNGRLLEVPYSLNGTDFVQYNFAIDDGGRDRVWFDGSPGDTFQLLVQIEVGSGSTGNVELMAEETNITLVMDEAILKDATFDLSDTLNSSIPLNELVQDVFTLFNCQTYTDSARKIVYAEPYIDFYNGTAEDWTNKVDISNVLKKDQLLTTYKRNIKFQFASDSNDAMVKDWEEKNKTRYQSKEITLADGFAAGDYIIETKHIAPTMMGQEFKTSSDRVPIPLLWKDTIKGKDLPEYSNDFNPRFLYYQGTIPGNWGWMGAEYDSTSFTLTGRWGTVKVPSGPSANQETSWPSAFSVNPDTDESSPIALSWSDYEHVNGLQHTYWRDFFNEVNEGYLLTVKANITARDISALWDDGNQKSLWRKPIWIRDRYYSLWEIKDYVPRSNDNIKDPIEIVLFTWSPPQAEDPVVVNKFGGDHLPDDGFPIKRPPQHIWGEGNGVPSVYQPGGDTFQGLYDTVVLNNGSGNSGHYQKGQTVLGNGNIAIGGGQTVVGNFNEPKEGAVLIVGAGTSDARRGNMVEVYTDPTGQPYAVFPDNELTIDTDGLSIGEYVQRVYFDSSGGALSCTLPPYDDFVHQYIELIDLGDADSNNITVDADGTNTINGSGTLVINTPYQVKRLYKSPTSGLWISG